MHGSANHETTHMRPAAVSCNENAIFFVLPRLPKELLPAWAGVAPWSRQSQPVVVAAA